MKISALILCFLINEYNISKPFYPVLQFNKVKNVIEWFNEKFPIDIKYKKYYLDTDLSSLYV